MGHVRGVHGSDNFRVASGVGVALSGGPRASSTMGRCGSCVHGRILKASLALTSGMRGNARLGFSSFSLCIDMIGRWLGAGPSWRMGIVTRGAECSSTRLRRFHTVVVRGLRLTRHSCRLLGTDLANTSNGSASSASPACGMLRRNTGALSGRRAAHLTRHRLGFVRKLRTTLIHVRGGACNVYHRANGLVPTRHLHTIPRTALDVRTGGGNGGWG